MTWSHPESYPVRNLEWSADFSRTAAAPYMSVFFCRRFQGVPPSTISEFQKLHTDFAALLLDLVASENGSDNSFGIVPDLSRLFYEVLAVPLHVLLVVRRHVVFHRAVLIRPAIESGVRADVVCVKENLHGSLCDAHIHFLFNVFIWNGIIHIAHGNVIVQPDSRHFPRCRLKRPWQKRQQKAASLPQTTTPGCRLFFETICG